MTASEQLQELPERWSWIPASEGWGSVWKTCWVSLMLQLNLPTFKQISFYYSLLWRVGPINVLIPSGYHILALLEFYRPTTHFLWKPASLSIAHFLQFNSSQTLAALWAQRESFIPATQIQTEQTTHSVTAMLQHQSVPRMWDTVGLNGSKSWR